MRRSGQGIPSSRVVVVSQPHPPSPVAAATAPTAKLRRVSVRSSCSAASPVSAGKFFGSAMRQFLDWRQFITGDHRAKIIPPGPDDLRNMDDKEEPVADRQHEVLGPRPG